MVASSGIASRRYELAPLRAEWRHFGAELSFDLSVNYGLCVIQSCAAMSFVGLRTQAGPRPVCLKHYNALLASPAELTA